MGLIDDLLDLQIPNNVKIEPIGQHVVYTTTGICRPKHADRTVSTLWLGETRVEKSARPLTSGEYNDTAPEWRPDCKSIAFISDRQRPGQTSAIYILPMKGGAVDASRTEDGDLRSGPKAAAAEPYSLTPADNERAIEMFRWSPDGKCIAYISADEKTPERKQREKDKDDANVWGEDLVRSRLRVVDFATKKVTTLVEGAEHVTGLAWSPDGTRIAFLHRKKPGIESECLDGCSVSVIGVETRSIRFVKHFTSGITNPVWAGKSLYFAANVDPTFLSSAQALWSIDLSSTRPKFQRELRGDDDCIGHFVEFGQTDLVLCTKKGMGTYFSTFGDKTMVRSYENDIASFDANLNVIDNEILLAVVKSTVNSPAEVYFTNETGTQHIQVSSHGDVLKDYKFGTATVIKCKSSDGEVELDAIYFSPAKPKGKTDAKGPFPTAVICHGGPYNRSTDAFNSHTMSWQPVLLEAGYGLLMPNYRGGSGHGDKFAATARSHIGIHDYEDVIQLTQLAIEKGYADKYRLLIGGWSHGGELAYLASVRNGQHGHDWRFQAAIPGAGATDSDTLRFTSDMGLTFERGQPGEAPWDSDVRSTTARTRRGAIWCFKNAIDSGVVLPAMLIMHCEQDKRVPIEQAVAMRRALQYHGLPFEFVSYPREGHRMVERMHVRDRMVRALRWADTYISPDV